MLGKTLELMQLMLLIVYAVNQTTLGDEVEVLNKAVSICLKLYCITFDPKTAKRPKPINPND